MPTPVLTTLTSSFPACYHVIISVIIGGNDGKNADTINGRTGKNLKKIATSRHLSVAELIRRAVDNIITTNVMVDADERRKRAINIVGKFHSGKHDISSEHDKYLAETFSE